MPERALQHRGRINSRARSEHGAVVLVGEQIEQLVRPLAHVADSLSQIDEQHLAPQLLHVLVEQDALQVTRARDLAHAHAANEDVALPLRQLVARVEGHARYRNRRRPVDDRILEPFAREAFRLPRPRVGAAEAHERPAVVRSGFQHVDLVAAVRSVFVLPNGAGRRMHGQAERAAVPERVDFRLVTFLADEWVVGRRRAVVAQPQNFAGEAVRILRILAAGSRTSTCRACRRGRMRAATRCSCRS